MSKWLIPLLAVLLITSLAGAKDIVWITENLDFDLDTVPDDQGWVDLLTDNGHTVNVQAGAYWTTLDQGKIDMLNAAELVIVGRCTNSGNYDDGSEPTQWNAVTAPMILMNSYLARSNRWRWINSTTLIDGGSPVLEAVDAGHPVFNGVTLNAGTVVALDNTVGTGNVNFIGSIDVGNGSLIAKAEGNDWSWIAEWDTGVEYYSGGLVAGGPRMLFSAGVREDDALDLPCGAYNLTADGETMFLNAVTYIPEPATIALLGLGTLALRRRRK